MSKTVINIGKVENVNPNVEKVESTFVTGEKKASKLTFDRPTGPTEYKPYKPYKIEIDLMGAKAHLCTIRPGQTEIDENGRWFYKVTISKGSALSGEFWEANGVKILDYIKRTL